MLEGSAAEAEPVNKNLSKTVEILLNPWKYYDYLELLGIIRNSYGLILRNQQELVGVTMIVIGFPWIS